MLSRCEVNTQSMLNNINSIGLRAFGDRLQMTLQSQIGCTDAKQLLTETDLTAVTFQDVTEQVESNSQLRTEDLVGTQKCRKNN